MTKKTESVVMNKEDDIYIDCQPVEADDTRNQSLNKDDSKFNSEILDDFTSTEFNIFDNIGFQSLIAIGIFTFILVSGNYVFNKLPNSRLQKAIDKESFS